MSVNLQLNHLYVDLIEHIAHEARDMDYALCHSASSWLRRAFFARRTNPKSRTAVQRSFNMNDHHHNNRSLSLFNKGTHKSVA